MTKYILKQIGSGLVTIFVLATVVFFLLRALPGDPFADPKISPELKQNLLTYYGLDKPVSQQYVIFLKNLLKGDLGYSLKYRNITVNDIIKQAFPYTADLGLRATIFAVVMSIILGIMAALKRNGPWDWACVIVATIGLTIPEFVLGTLMQDFLGNRLKILPIADWKGFKYTIMPVLTMTIGTIGWMSMMMRASMLEVGNQDYIKTAKSKGLSVRQVVFKHQIRNAILPIITNLGVTITGFLAGTLVAESIFALPGLGKFFNNSITNLDYSMILGLTVFFGSFLIVCNIIVEIVYGFIDPRIRISRR